MSLGSFLGLLIIWLVKRDTMPFVADQAKEALNFGITLTIPLFLLVGLGALILVIIAALKAGERVAYRYPLTLLLVK